MLMRLALTFQGVKSAESHRTLVSGAGQLVIVTLGENRRFTVMWLLNERFQQSCHLLGAGG